jgi:hypothetical protein
MFALIIVVLLLLLYAWAALVGKLGNFRGGVGNALVQLNTFTRPTTQHIIEVNQERKKENKHGDDGPPAAVGVIEVIPSPR